MLNNNKVLAVVNGKELTANDLDLFQRSFGQKASQFDSNKGKEFLLNELINNELFYFEALKQGLDKNDEYQRELERMKETLLRQYAIKEFVDQITISDEEVSKYYEDNKENFIAPLSYNAKHILVNDEEQALIISKEISEGLDFSEAAKKYSTCPSSKNGGDLGYFTKGQMVPEFEKATEELGINEISKPVKTNFGFHLIQLIDIKQPEIKELAEIKDDLKNQLMIMKRNEQYKLKCDELRKIYKIEIL